MNFKTFIKGIQQSLNSKEYIKKGTTIDDFVKSKWNISKCVLFIYISYINNNNTYINNLF